jgi:hypothetical protein
MIDGVRISPDQARAARVLLGLGKLYVCHELGIAPLTLDRAEMRTRDGPPAAAVFHKLRRHYEAAGVEFENGGQVKLAITSLGAEK